ELGEGFEAGKIVDWKEVVHVRERGEDSLSEGLVVGGAQQWIEPEEAVAGALEMLHFRGQQLRIAAIPPVADDDDDRAVPHATSRPLAVEHAERLADTGAARPILDLRA